jgi:hypothetical protein
MKLNEVEQPITPTQLNALEKALDALFQSLGIDVEFTRHFIDRVNDERNQEQITMPELVNMFKKEYQRWGKPIAQMGPDSEAVMKDLESDINIPFVLKWDRDNQELDLVAKSVMRKKNFKTSNKEFPVESKTYNTMSNVGKAKYVVNFHDGEKTHKDGSRFYDMSIFKNAKDLENFEKQLKSKGYVKEDETPTETPTPMRRISDEEKLAMFNELKAGDTVHLWYDSAFKRGEKYKPFKMGRRTKSEKYNLSKFSMQQISAEGVPAGVKFFLYKRGDKVSLAMGDMAATLVDMQTDLGESAQEKSNDDFYLIVEYNKGQPVKQSDPLRVLDNLASRKDNMPFPIKFKDNEEIKVTPELARRFTMAYHDIARPEQKEVIKQYLRTKEGFKKIVNQMQLKKNDFGKNANANLASLDRNIT